MAHTQVEKKICSNPYLASADNWMAKLYQERLTAIAAEQHKLLLKEQRAWLKGLDDCLERDAPDVTRPELGGSIECLARDYDLRIKQLEAPLSHFVDLNHDTPDASDVYEAVTLLKARGLERLIELHQLRWRTIDIIADSIPSEVTTHLRHYVDANAWNDTQWDERDLTGEPYSIGVFRVSLFPGRPDIWVLSTESGTLHNVNLWLFESSADGAKAVRFIGHIGDIGDIDAMFVRFRGQPFVVEKAIFEDPLIYDLDQSKPVKR